MIRRKTGWMHIDNRNALVNQRISILQCPSAPDPERLDGVPENQPVGG